ncbi:MAG: LysM domain-containing protein [Patescibacteria group bacterium]
MAIAAKYNIASSDISSFNQLGEKAMLRIGMELMIPGAQKKATVVATTTTPTSSAAKPKPVPQATPSTRPVTVDASGLKSSYAIVYTGKNRGFVPGNCTAYVAQNKNVTWRGNANMWIKNARAQ